VTDDTGKSTTPRIVEPHTGVGGGGATVTLVVQDGLVIEPLTLHTGVNVPPVTYRHTQADER
jgi:hypothetical protein